jgi:hypothetical protein
VRILIPDDIIGSATKLVSSTITDDLSGVSEWSAATTYTAGDEVQYRHTSYTAKTIDEGTTNVGQTPGPVSEYWAEGAPSNKWSMFDAYVSTQSIGTTDTAMVVVLDSARDDSIALLGMDHVESIRIQQEYVPTGETVADETIYLTRSGRDAVSATWWEYFYGEVILAREAYIEFDAWTSSRITLTITPETGYAPAVGHCIIGQTRTAGTAQWGVSPSLVDYSKVSRNESTGKAQLIQGNYAISMQIPIMIDNSLLDDVARTLTRLRARPAVFDANEGGTSWETIITYGFVRKFTTVVQGAVHSSCTLQVEGLI